jgi:hypothetical protein
MTVTASVSKMYWYIHAPADILLGKDPAVYFGEMLGGSQARSLCGRAVKGHSLSLLEIATWLSAISYRLWKQPSPTQNGPMGQNGLNLEVTSL